MGDYKIFTDATADFNFNMLNGYPSVEVIPMQVEVDGVEYTYGPNGNISVKEFYDLQRNGKFAATSQINPTVYTQIFKNYLDKGKDIIYLCFSSGMSGTLQSAKIAINELQEEYPERKIICIDTLCAASGEGFLICEAARKQSEGLKIYELADWVEKHKLEVCHWFTVDIFDHLKHGGRVSAAAATIGSMLNIKPLLHVDDEGKLVVMDKPRGRKKAMQLQINCMKKGWKPEIGKLVLIGHGDCLEVAEQLKELVKKNFPDAEIALAEIGPIIGAHTGPGMLSLIYWGSNR